MTNLLISVVTVVFNSKNGIEKTIKSIVNQSYKNIEYIIIDGKSEDGTIDIIKQNETKISLLISERDDGIYDAMNKALKVANGDFLIFMNAGDTFCSSDTLSNVVDTISEFNAVYYGNAIYFYEYNNSFQARRTNFSKYRLSKTNICHQTIFYPKCAYQRYSYELKYKLFSDWAYNMQLFLKIKFIYLNQDIAIYDANGKSALNNDIEFKKDQVKLIFKFLGLDVFFYLALNKLIKSLCYKNNNLL